MGSVGIVGPLAPDGVVLRLRDWRASRPLPLLLYAEGMMFGSGERWYSIKLSLKGPKGESSGGIVEGVLGEAGNIPTHAVAG